MSRASRTVRLRTPVQVGGKDLAEVVVRASTVGDEEDAMQQAVTMQRGSNPVTVEICLLSKVTRLPYDALRGMSGPDYAALREALSAVNGRDSADGTEPAGENPTETTASPDGSPN